MKNIDFLSATSNIIQPEIELIDYDQAFLTSSPPNEVLGTPLAFLAPEVACGRIPGPASDIWALGCCILRLRSGENPFENPYSVTTPEDLVNFIVHHLGGQLPDELLIDLRWDEDGMPTTSPDGQLYEQWWEGKSKTLREIVNDIWDEPEGRTVGNEAPDPQAARIHPDSEDEPISSVFSNLVWNPRAVKVNGAYVDGYGGEWDSQLKLLPKIPAHEAALLYDLLSKIFVYDPRCRPSMEEILGHPWFHMDEVEGL